MKKNVLVPEKLLCDVLLLVYWFNGELDIDDPRHLCKSIESAINNKIEKMQRRKIFTAYKTSPPGTEREALRKDYVERTYIHKSFTSSQEVPYESM
jgi:hypothetical protein